MEDIFKSRLSLNFKPLVIIFYMTIALSLNDFTYGMNEMFIFLFSTGTIVMRNNLMILNVN